ncbi:MAG: peptidase T [Oscillospiraceae bacterium]|nr:peptidase T [Oscillospiraceae bacterium]
MDVKTLSLQDRLMSRFLRYAAVTTQSKSGTGVIPSTSGQWDLARLLMQDISELGVVDVTIDEHAVVVGRLPARLPEGHCPVPVVGWVTHMDTVDVGMAPEIHPIVIRNYQGGDICQNEEKQISISVKDHPELLKYIGQDLIVSDGTSVLGADDKAAVANVLVALEVLAEHPEFPHGEIYVCFVPDEEIGLCGAKSMDFSRFPVDFAYTIDCCEQGELVYQTFNAGHGKLYITGVTAHPMSSKNNTVNPILIAHDFMNLLDRGETPEHTEKTEGYIWVTGIQGNQLNAVLDLNIRDHDRGKYLAKKEYLKACTEMMKLRHPKAKLSLELEDDYSNIKDALTPENRKCVDFLFQAMEALDIVPLDIAMRGGTDGSFISTKGIPTPNYFTGAHNFHSSCEFMPMGAVENSCRMTLKLIELITNG